MRIRDWSSDVCPSDLQPAEEGAPEGEQGGASRMLAEGLFADFKPEAMFGLHVIAGIPSDTIAVRPGPFMAGSDRFTIKVIGRQTHGAKPWGGVDPIVTAAQIVTGAQTLVSRRAELTRSEEHTSELQSLMRISYAV